MASIREHMRTLVKLDAFALGIMHVSSRYINATSSGKNMLKTGGGKYFSWKYGEVFYHVYGSGSPVLLLHELDPSFSSYEWTEIVEDLSENHTVYAVDLPGCGRSTKRNMVYTNYFYVLFLTAFIKEVIRKKCTVIASGYSSSFAISACAMEESLIGKIVAVNPRGMKDLKQSSDEKAKAASTLIRLPVIGTTVYNITESKNNINLAFTEKYMYNPFRSKARYVDAFYEGAHYNEGKGKYLLASIEQKSLSVTLDASLKKIGDRLVIIYGEKSAHGEAYAEQYIKDNPAITALPVPQTKYIPHLERPQEFISVCKTACGL